MKRRTVIRNVLVMSAGAAFLYSCKENAASEQEVLSELAETILPKTDFPGAKDLNTADFILIMVNDCFPPEEQQKFTAGLKAFSESGFVKMSPEERKAYIDKLDGDAKVFFGMVKEGTIQNLVTSEQYLRDVQGITTLIPPKFQACIPVNA